MPAPKLAESPPLAGNFHHQLRAAIIASER